MPPACDDADAYNVIEATGDWHDAANATAPLLALVLRWRGCAAATSRVVAAYIAILGPTTLTITCPPHGFQATETMPDDTTTVREPP